MSIIILSINRFFLNNSICNFIIKWTRIGQKIHCATFELLQDEVKRYITWPGQACGYKIGELKISELRKKASDKLKSKFDIRDFHEVILSSSGPLNAIEDEVDGYITKFSA
jgi:hypothetical protein